MSPLATYLVETSITLVGIAGLAVLVIALGRRFGLGRPSSSLELVGKLALDARRAVYLIRVNDLVYVLAASEGGMVQLGTFDAAQLPGPRNPIGSGVGIGSAGAGTAGAGSAGAGSAGAGSAGAGSAGAGSAGAGSFRAVLERFRSGRRHGFVASTQAASASAASGTSSEEEQTRNRSTIREDP